MITSVGLILALLIFLYGPPERRTSLRIAGVLLIVVLIWTVPL